MHVLRVDEWMQLNKRQWAAWAAAAIPEGRQVLAAAAKKSQEGECCAIPPLRTQGARMGHVANFTENSASFIVTR